MNRTTLSILFLLSIIFSSFSQDIITKKIDGTITAKILEVSKKEIKYKKFDNLNGPTFFIDIADIVMIQYENGTKDVFNEGAESPFKISDTSNFTQKGIEDANINYTGVSSGKGWTAATTILLSPIFGIIPAIGCASSRPKNSNLNYRDAELMKNNEYNLAYTSEATKIKRKRIWRSFGISSGVWGVLYIVSLNQQK